jgi:phosphatidate phosphatase
MLSAEEPSSLCSRSPWLDFFDIPGLVTVALLGIVLLVIFLTVPLSPLYVPPNDALSNFPYPASESVPMVVAGVLIFAMNAILIAGLLLLSSRFPDYFRRFNLFPAIWTFVGTGILVMIVTEILKNYVGRPRPDKYARSGYNATYDQCKAELGHAGDDEFKSWPSGHSSESMYGGTFAALFFQKVVTSDHLWVATVGAAFLLFGFGIGASRIRDYRHHADDVLAGLFVGWVCTYTVWVRAKKRIFVETVPDDGFHKAEP